MNLGQIAEEMKILEKKLQDKEKFDKILMMGIISSSSSSYT